MVGSRGLAGGWFASLGGGGGGGGGLVTAGVQQLLHDVGGQGRMVLLLQAGATIYTHTGGSVRA